MADTKKKTASSGKRGASSASRSGSGRSGAQARSASAPQRRPVRREVWAVVCFFIGLFSFLGYFRIDALFITYICGTVKGLIGYGYWVFPICLLACSVMLLLHRGRPVRARTICMLLVPLLAGALVHLLVQPEIASGLKIGALIQTLFTKGRAMRAGGVLSGLLAMGLKALLSVYGAVPLVFFALLALLMLALKISPAAMAQRMREREKLQYEPEPEPERPAAGYVPVSAAQPNRGRLRHAIDIPMDDEPAVPEIETPDAPEKRAGFFNRNPRVKTPDEALEKFAPAAAPATPAAPPPTAAVRPLSVEEAADIAGVKLASPEEMVKTEGFSTAEVRERRSAARRSMDAGELKSETDEIAKAAEAKDAAAAPEYRYPPVELLRQGSGAGVDGREEMAINSERLQSTLDSFGVSATITDITRGPTVTRYDLELDAGVKLSKLTNLAGDLALSLGVSGVRIAPIPDKISTVGIEVPNKIVSTVFLRDIIDSDTFRGASSRLTFALGKDIAASPVVGNIAKLPHLLIAGTTGSGKSVCMNCLILSLLYKSTPEEVRLIMIDPKMVELGIYNGIPHLYVPVVTDPKKAAGSLQWSVIEMLKRYRLFSEAGVRDLAGYNAIRRKNGESTMPQVVIVIDELADLMMTAAKEVEESICRIAQMGRAAGMHLVIATQRPSADVITGLMKANIPSRIAFAVSSAMESRIILDQMGAEKLVGAGDMLYAPLGIGKPTRIQGAFVTDEEREEVVNFVKLNGEAQYNAEIQEAMNRAAEESKSGSGARAESVDEPEEEGGAYDELLPQAVEVIFETKQASVSMLQRRLKLGYSRAARIVDQMEEIGVVGPFEGSKPRQILVTREQWQEMQHIHGTAPVEQPGQVSFADYEDDAADRWNDV